MRLATPFGNVVIELNEKPCAYQCKELPKVVLNKDGEILWSVDGRYKVIPQIEDTAAFPLRLNCKIDTTLKLEEYSGMEGGEYYSSMAMYHDGIKLSIGSYDDIDPETKKGDGWIQVIGGGCICSDFTDTSIEIYVGEGKYLKYAFFCVAWKTLCGDDIDSNGENDVWFLAEPAAS